MDQKREALITCAEALFLVRPYVESCAAYSPKDRSWTFHPAGPEPEQAQKALNLLDTAAEAARQALASNDEPEGQK